MKTKNRSILFFIFVLSLAACGQPSGSQPNSFFENLGTHAQQIQSIALSSSCANYSWRNRGRAPAGYVGGLALAYGRSLCRFKRSSGADRLTAIMSAADSHNDSVDALSYFQSIFKSLQITTDVAGEDALTAIYSLGTGLGMRESSGAYCEGWDTTAGSNRPSSAGEAGLFQVSYDSIGTAPELQQLYADYQAHPNKCLLDVFSQEATCTDQSILGKGAGAAFQVFNKSCPAFATEYAITLLRILRTHFGPINRREAEVRPECYALLRSVQKLVDEDPNGYCQDLL